MLRITSNILLAVSPLTGFSTAGSSTSSGGSSLRKREGWQGISWPIFFAAGAMADDQRLHGARDGHVKQSPLFIQRAFDVGARMRQQASSMPTI